MFQDSLNKRIIRLVFGINVLVFICIGLLMSVDMFGVVIPGYNNNKIKIPTSDVLSQTNLSTHSIFHTSLSTHVIHQTNISTNGKPQTNLSTNGKPQTNLSTNGKPQSNMPTNGLSIAIVYANSIHKTNLSTNGISHTNLSTNKATPRGSKVTTVAFLKVHKAGSTTMQNLFFRFGIRHDLNILLPVNGHYMFNMKGAIRIKKPHTYSIFACHTRYSKEFFDQLFPEPSVKIGIVREPVDRLISAAYYYRDVYSISYLTKIPPANFIHNLISQQDKYDTSYFSRTKNAMANDFGFRKGIYASDSKAIQSTLESLNSDFSLVMIMERFDESLVMMKRLLSWSFLDIIYLQKNSHDHKPVVLNKDEQDTARKNNFLDFAIYEYFTEIFDNKVKSMDKNFQDEVTLFKEILAKVFTFCSDKNITDDSKLFIEASKWDTEFTVPSVECKWMHTGELDFVKQLKEKLKRMS